MGFNTVAVLLNDRTHEFEASGDLGRRIAAEMRSYGDSRRVLPGWFGAGKIISQAHADYSQVVIVGRNTGCRIEDAKDLDWHAIDQMKRCLESRGYKVTKKPPPRSLSKKD